MPLSLVMVVIIGGSRRRVEAHAIGDLPSIHGLISQTHSGQSGRQRLQRSMEPVWSSVSLETRKRAGGRELSYLAGCPRLMRLGCLAARDGRDRAGYAAEVLSICDRPIHATGTAMTQSDAISKKAAPPNSAYVVPETKSKVALANPPANA